MFPFSSEKITLSASPSKAMPKSAPCNLVSLAILSGNIAPHWKLIFFPFGSAPIMLVSAPSSNKTSGPTLYDAPFAQSNTTFNPLKSSCFGSICLTNSEYLPLASSILLALPKSADFAKVGVVSIFN